MHSCYLLRPNESQNAFNGDNKWNFVKVILSPLSAISCQKSYTQTGNMLLLQWSWFVILWNAGIWKRKFSSVVESLFCGGGSFLLDWGFWFSPTSKQKRSLLTVLPENLMAFLTLGNNLKVELFFTRNQLPLLIPPHNLYGAPAISFMVVSWTSPKPSLLHVCLLGPPWSQFLQVCPLGIFRACHWCDLCSCFLSGFLSAFPIP